MKSLQLPVVQLSKENESLRRKIETSLRILMLPPLMGW